MNGLFYQADCAVSPIFAMPNLDKKHFCKNDSSFDV